MEVCRDKGGNEEKGERQVEEGKEGRTGGELVTERIRERRKYVEETRLKEGSNRGKKGAHTSWYSSPRPF